MPGKGSITEISSPSSEALTKFKSAGVLSRVELTQLPGTAIRSALVPEMPSMSHSSAASELPVGWNDTGTSFYLLFFVTFLVKVKVFYRKQKNYIWWKSRGIWEDGWWTGSLQGPPRCAGLAVPLSLGPLLKS